MPRKIVYENLNAEIVDIRGLLEDLKSKKFNGYILINKWNEEIYCIIKNGNLEKAVSFDSNGRKELRECKEIPKDEGTVSVIETDPLELIHVFHDIPSIQFAGPTVLSGYGNPIQQPIKMSHINFENIKRIIEREKTNGYAVFFDEDDILGNIIFYEGKTVNAFSKGLFREEALNFLTKKISPTKHYVAVYSVEPELLLFINSLDRLGKIQKGRLSSFKDLQMLINEASKEKNSFILEAILNNDVRYYFFFFHGSLIKGININKGVFKDAYIKDLGSLIKEGITFSIIHINIEMNPEPIKLDGFKRSVNEFVSKEKIIEIKNAFIESIGPVGNFIWNKTLNDYGVSEDEITRDLLDYLINSLSAEIPDSTYVKKFIEKVRGILK